MILRKKRIKDSLQYSIWGAAFNAAMVGFGESFFSAFAVFLKASNFELGLLTSLPLTLGSLFELFSAKLLDFFGSRKRMISFGILIQAFMYIPIALAYFSPNYGVFLLIVFASIYLIAGMIIVPAWSSWMGDLVNKKVRGAYFGFRNEVAGITSFVTFVIAGYLLQYFSSDDKTLFYGYSLIFGLAFLSRMISLIFILLKYEPSLKEDGLTKVNFIEFAKGLETTNFGLLVLFLSLVNFTAYIAAPFFTVYMLNDLKFSYGLFTIIIGISILVKYLAMPLWGNMSDIYGTRKILSFTSFIIPLSPILWFLSPDYRYLALVQVFSGFFWAGFEIASFNFLFDASTPSERVSFIAYFNVFNGFAIFLGSLFGAFIVNYVDLFWSPYLSVFLISGILRYIVVFVFIPKLKEVRSVQNISYDRLLLNLFRMIPGVGTISDLILHHENQEVAPDEDIKPSRGIRYKWRKSQ